MISLKQFRRGLRIFLATFWIIAFAWLFYSLQARGFDASVLESDGDVQVNVTNETIAFKPLTDPSSVGLIFYPGALVDPDAYAPFARAVAEAGYFVTIVKVPFGMDLFDWQSAEVVARTEAIIAEEVDQTAWIVGGHSRGAKMAAQLASEHPELFKGLLLVGTSHPRENDLSHLQLDVVKIYGSADGLASEEEVEAFAGNLPASTHFVRIDGGNHRQFGYYGWQLGDGQASIDRATQQQQTVDAILAQLRRVAP